MIGNRVLVTGGAGYIGGHTAKLLSTKGVEPIVYDNLVTGNRYLRALGPLFRGQYSRHSKSRQDTCARSGPMRSFILPPPPMLASRWKILPNLTATMSRAPSPCLMRAAMRNATT